MARSCRRSSPPRRFSVWFFLPGKEKVTGLTILGTVAVVAGTIAIALGK
ncbi:MAG TPA: hypothetical protein VKR81_06295 [Candidatus Binatia bacterium]|nr:hypothetical protein [Candidatus Binatia bacterium]